MQINLIVATGMAPKGKRGLDAIGVGDSLPEWDAPGDLARFRDLTMGQTVLFGRRTYDAMRRAPLAGRDNIVLTSDAVVRNAASTADNELFVSTLGQAIQLADPDKEIWICGGAQLYAEALDLGIVDVIECTRVHTVVDDADVYMPPKWLDGFEWDTEGMEAFATHSYLRFYRA